MFKTRWVGPITDDELRFMEYPYKENLFDLFDFIRSTVFGDF